MSVEYYLRNLNEQVKANPSQIKQLIQDLPKLKGQLLFSKLKEQEDRDRYCFLLELLMKRVSVSSRRSKQAFTSMWDSLRECLEMILNDELTIKYKEDNINVLLRRILQMNIVPSTRSVECSCEWLAMDLDTQLKKITYSNGLDHVRSSICDELNLKTLYLYCDQFHFPDYPKVFLKLTSVNSELINLFFNTKYFNAKNVAEYIETKESFPYEFIKNLKSIPSTIWLEFSDETIVLLVNKLKSKINAANKETCVIFELFEVITTSLDYRNGTNNLKGKLIDIVKMDVFVMSDVVQSKFWCFVSAVLSCECLSSASINIESKIINTLKSDNIKAKVSVCRVISLYWNQLEDHDLIESMLLDSITKYENNKLRWNIAITLMNSKASESVFISIKDFLMIEMEKFGNFKVILSYVKLLQKWSNEGCGDLLDSESFETVWTFLNRLKLFINSNFGNLECEDGEGLVEIAMKLEVLIKSILIGGE